MENKEVYSRSKGADIDEMIGMVGEPRQTLSRQMEELVPKEVRRKLQEPMMKRLGILGVYLIIGTLWGWRGGWQLFGWWVGGLLGFFLLDTDHLLDVYFLHPEKESSREVNAAVKSRKWREVWRVLLNTAAQRERLVLHSVLFEVVIVVLMVYVVTSSGGLFAKGLVLSFMLRILYEQIKEFMSTGKMEKWFWQLREPVPKNLQAVFLTVGLVVWVVLSAGAF